MAPRRTGVWRAASARALLVAMALTSTVLAAQDHPAERVALVIGNADYPQAPLRNPVNDARDLAAALRGLGFDVLEFEDASRDAMARAVVEFGSRLGPDTVGLFYYAGHGLQVRGENYLVPVDATLDSEAEVRVEAIGLELVLGEMAWARNRLNIVILDACRNNPFERRLRGGPRGLAAVDAARGTLIAYATAPGSVAADGDGRNGIYTEALLGALARPGLDVEALFKSVRIEVARRTRDAQIPWESSSLTGEFSFNPAAASGPTAASAAAAPATDAGGAAELLFWESIKDGDDPAAFRAYLDRYPDGTFAPLARLRIEGGRRARDVAPVRVRVRAEDDWTSTGVRVRSGEVYLVEAEGRWKMAALCNETEADAVGLETNLFCASIGNEPLPGASFQVMIGRIGEDGAPFVVGKRLELRAPADGLLYLRSNSSSLFDNSGTLTVTISPARE